MHGAHRDPDARAERTLRNLAFIAERDRRIASAKLDELRKLQEAPAGNGSPAGELGRLRRRVAELETELGEARLALAEATGSPRPGAGALGPARGLRARFRRRGGRLARRLRRSARLARASLRSTLFGRSLGVLRQYPPRELRLPKRYERELALSSPPAISVVTPSLNQGRFLEATIQSVLGQGYPRLEYVVQDGNSTDGTAAILDRYAGRLHHCEMRDDEGQANAINLGFGRTSGELMAFVNSDDLLLPGALRYAARYFERHPEVDLVYGHRILIDEDGLEIGRWVMPRHDDDVLSWADWVPQETMVWRRELWERAGAALDESFRLTLDWDLLLRFRDAGAKMVRLPRFLGAFRVHDEQHTATLIGNIGKDEMARLRERALGREVTRQEINRAVRSYRWRNHILQKAYRAGIVRY